MNDEDKSREELLEEIEALRRENRQLKQRANLETRTEKPVKKNTTGKTLLIVDDNEGTRELVMEMVEELGFRAIAAGTSEQALAIFARTPDDIDLIISDIVMPDGDGPHLLREIRKISRPAKVIFMSGYASDEVIHDAVYQIQDSKAAFIKKPFSMADLDALIQEQLNPTRGES